MAEPIIGVVHTEPATPRRDPRQWLLQADQAATRDFDRTVVALASGALGLSIAFIHDIAPHPVHEGWLAIAWSLLSASLIANLASLLTSHHALRWEMRHYDDAVGEAGGWLGKVTIGLNWFAAAAFFSASLPS